MIRIEKLTTASEQAVGEINHLLAQLRENAAEHPASYADLEKIVADPNIALMVAIDDGRICGMASLYMLTKLGKRTGSVEDVVVDSAYRGQGLGEKLMHALMQKAREEQVWTLHLTSRPERVAANKLYQKIGFKQKQTNAYIMKL